MNYLISYDIQEDPLRLRLSKFLLKRGCERMQKSVFVSMDMNAKEFLAFEQRLNALLQAKLQQGDSVWVVPMQRQQIEDSTCHGNRGRLDDFLKEELYYFV